MMENRKILCYAHLTISFFSGLKMLRTGKASHRSVQYPLRSRDISSQMS